MFEVFVRERAITKKLNSGEFERRVTALEKVGSSEKAAFSRFTLYERGLITREDILKTYTRPPPSPLLSFLHLPHTNTLALF